MTFRTALVAAIVGALPGTSAAGEPTCELRLVGYGYTVCYEPGFAHDAELARDIVDLAAQRLRWKYGPADPVALDVKLYGEPTGRVRSGYTYFDGSAIHCLTPSPPAPVPAGSCRGRTGANCIGNEQRPPPGNLIN